MKIGALGNLPFYIEGDKVQTFKDMKWDSKANYQTHSLHMQKGRLELTGFDPDTVSFEMELSAYLGVKPDDALTILDSMLANGTVSTLVIGTRTVGNSWVVSSVSRGFNHLYKDGKLISMNVSVTLMEYV